MEYGGAIESKSGVCKENERNRNRDRMVLKLEWAIVPCGNKRAPAEFMNEGLERGKWELDYAGRVFSSGRDRLFSWITPFPSMDVTPYNF